MAGTSLKRPIGVGPALEKARRIRGLSLDEASRDTRLRVDQLTALETEDFAALPNDAFVRGALRTYAQYLGVDPDKVLGAYGRHAAEPVAPAPPEGLGRIERAIAATRIRDTAVPAVPTATSSSSCSCSGSSPAAPRHGRGDDRTPTAACRRRSMPCSSRCDPSESR
jgi:hypothetical protein